MALPEEEDVFQTERLRARAWCEADLALAMELWGDPAVMALMDTRGALSQELVREKLHAEIDRRQKLGLQYWALFTKVGGDFVGCCGLRPWTYTNEPDQIELGFHLLRRQWNKGFASEAARGAIRFGFERLRLKEVFAGHNPKNTASQNVLEKLGFQRQGEVFYEPTGLMHPSYILKRP